MGTKRDPQRGSPRAPKRGTATCLIPELLHVTLCFLGNRPAAEMDVFARALVAMRRTGVASCRSVRPCGCLSATPRALAVELHDNDGRLGRMQTQVLAALREVSGWQPGGGEPGSADPTTGARQRSSPTRHGCAYGSRCWRPRACASTYAFAVVHTYRSLLLYRSWPSRAGSKLRNNRLSSNRVSFRTDLAVLFVEP